MVELYSKLVVELKVNPDAKANVVYARDTRASGSSLVASLVDALKATNTEYTDFKLMTTPQLHYIVRCVNTKDSGSPYGEVSEKGYYEKLGKAFKTAMQGKKFNGTLTVDCANGVGGPKLRELIKYLPPPSEGGLEIKVINDDVLRPQSLNVLVNYSLNLLVV